MHITNLSQDHVSKLYNRPKRCMLTLSERASSAKERDLQS